jgi:glycosyltransferase involved in cell wall biosynthesis
VTRRTRRSRRARTSLRSVALIEPLGDAGIGSYTHELAEALVHAGVTADVYGPETAWSRSLPRVHRLYSVLGSALFRQQEVLASSGRQLVDSPPVYAVDEDETAGIPAVLRAGRTTARTAFLTLELATVLRRRGYDAVWTQWPEFGAALPNFWRTCRRLGVRVIHTVHNVVPHERRPGDERHYGRVYRACDVLLVHSHAAAESLHRTYPGCGAKALVSPHGLYTIYPRRPEARAGVRAELGLQSSTPLVLFFGGIRPYKNVDVVLHALRGAPDLDLALLVAGSESGYADRPAGDGLARTRRLAAELGVESRVRFLAGPFGFERTSEIFEAADAVILPYVESFGSGQLLLAMTFGRWIAATAAGGMDEYLSGYPRGVVLPKLTPESVAETLRDLAIQIPAAGDAPIAWQGGELSWGAIVEALLPRLESRL